MQTFNEETFTLTIIDSSEFTNDHQSNTKHLVISNGITEIPEKAFFQWMSLTTALIADSVTIIESYAFQYCYSLEEVSFGEGITNIGSYAFGYCTSLKNLTIKCLTTVESNVFIGCAGLETVTFDEGVQAIGSLMFQNCGKLKYVTIPSTVSSISTNPFLRCSNLQFIKVSNESSHFSNYENDGVLYDKEITKLIVYPNGNSSETFKVPNSVTSIESHGFDSCTNLLTISFGNNVNIIKDSAFSNCAFTSFTIPNSVTDIQTSAFSYCTQLETVVIGENVKIIGEYTFSGCSLKCIYFYGETSPT